MACVQANLRTAHTIVEELRAVINTGKIDGDPLEAHEYKELASALGYLSIEAKANYVEKLLAEGLYGVVLH